MYQNDRSFLNLNIFVINIVVLAACKENIGTTQPIPRKMRNSEADDEDVEAEVEDDAEVHCLDGSRSTLSRHWQ